jgi:Tol biopolymer transport system component/DNA-binding winged helix-turn-helix (wHTH) protein
MTDQPGILRFGVFEVHLAAGELRKSGSRVKLQEQPFQVLVTLLKRPGEIVTREELKEKLWAGDTFVDFDHSLSTAVNKIREVLGDSATNPRFIETVPRKGYRFIGGAGMAQGGAAELAAEAPKAPVASRRRWAWGFAGIALVALGVFGISKWQSEARRSSAPEGPVPFTSLRGSEERPAFSPDGTRVAFSWSGEAGDNVDIYVQVAGSSNRLRLTSDPAIDEAPSWSADGRQIAFVRTSDRGQTICLTSPVGGPERRVVEFSHRSLATASPLLGRSQTVAWGGLAWSPDSKSILFCERETSAAPAAIYRLFLETGEKQRLTSPPVIDPFLEHGDSFPAVSPDGRTLAFARGTTFNTEIYVVPLGGGEARALTSQGQMTLGLTWTADGREIVYAKTPTLADVRGWLWRVSAAGGDPRVVQGAGQDVRYPASSAQGKLVYERVNSDANVWLYPFPGEDSGASPQQVIASTYVDYEPRISPQGDRIVFSSNRTGYFEIWVSDLDGSNLTQLTSLKGWAGSPRWSPDGLRIAFDSNARGNWDILVIDAQGGPPRQLTRDESFDARPSWSHDGGWLYFASDRGGTFQIWKQSPDGGEAVQVTQSGGFQPFESADGRFVYFERSDFNFEVWRVPVEGGEEAAVRQATNTAAWALGAKGFYYVEYMEASTDPGKWVLRLLPFDATEPVDVMEVPPPRWASSLDVSPDGKSFAYVQSDRVESDLMLIENFE